MKTGIIKGIRGCKGTRQGGWSGGPVPDGLRGKKLSLFCLMAGLITVGTFVLAANH